MLSEAIRLVRSIGGENRKVATTSCLSSDQASSVRALTISHRHAKNTKNSSSLDWNESGGLGKPYKPDILNLKP